MAEAGESVESWQTTIGGWHRWKWGNPGPAIMAAKLTEEVGEVCEAVVKRVQDHPKASEMDLAGELADVLIVAMAMADLEGIDLEAALVSKTERLPGW